MWLFFATRKKALVVKAYVRHSLQGGSHMSNKIVCIREALYSAIRSVCSVSWLFARAPGHDFTRNGKLPLEKLITFILSLKGGPLASELMDHFGCSADIASVPAFVKRRGRLLPEAFSFLFHLFVERTQLSTLFHGFRLLAVDGSDLHIPTDPDDTDSFFPGKDDSKPYNLLHLDALYDLMSHTYLDASVSPKRLSDECRALCDMVDRADLSHPAIILADRGYESYNVLAHILQKGWKFLIRVKNGVGGIVSGLPIPNSEEFDIQVNLSLTRKQTNQAKALALASPFFKILSSDTVFDFLPIKNRKSVPVPPFQLHFRVVRFKLSDNSVETVITNLDFSPDQLKQLYAMRWGIETSFRELKYTVGLLHFHAKKAEHIYQEIFARLIMYNFSELITSSVIIRKADNKYAYKANFTAAVHVCRQFFLRNVSPSDVEAVICRNVTPVRPGRNSPRNLSVKRAVSFTYRVA